MHPPIISIISQYTTAYNIKIEKFDKKISRKGLKERILKFFYLEEVFKTRLTIDQDGPRIRIRVQGTGFLYNMVRIIAGTLLRVGTGFWPPEQVEEILRACDRAVAGPTAPPEGLLLVKIDLKR